MQLTHSTSRTATYDDMCDMGLYRVYVYQGNVVIVPDIPNLPNEYDFKDAAIFIHSNGNVKKNRFGRVTPETRYVDTERGER
jgi:hypothetical protein